MDDALRKDLARPKILIPNAESLLVMRERGELSHGFPTLTT
jgi:hypothetical protein